MTDPTTITCDDCRQRLQEFALDELSAGVHGQVAAHLAGGCADCNRQLAGIAADFAALTHALPLDSPPPHIERDLMRRIAATASATPLRPQRIGRRSLTRSLLAAAAVLAACLVGVAAWTTWRDVAASRSLSEFIASLQTRLDDAEKAQHFVSVPELSFVSVRGSAPEAPVHGYIVADRVARQWHVYIFRLPALPVGRSYQMWFVTPDDRYTSAGIVAADTDGTVSQLVDVPSEIPAIVGLAVSDELAAGSIQPTGEHLYQADLP